MASSGLTLQGQVINVGETIDNNGFKKRLLWLEIDQESQYPQTVEIEFVQDKTALLNPVTEGAIVSVDINIRGKLFTNDKGTRCYNSLGGWRLKVDKEGKQSNKSSNNPIPTSTDPPVRPLANPDDDLPF